jgi:hypothetical protein
LWAEKYFYAGSANGGNSLQSIGQSHRWSDNNNQNQEAMCVKKIGNVANSAQKANIDYEGFTFYPTEIKGVISNSAILAACQSRGLMTPCDREFTFEIPRISTLLFITPNCCHF